MRTRRTNATLKYAVIGLLVLMVVGLSGMYQVAIENFPRPEPFPTTTMPRPTTDLTTTTTTTTTNQEVTLSGTVTVEAWNVETEQMDSWSWALGDDVSPEFDSAVVNGTLVFTVDIEQGADDVTGVTLEVDQIDGDYYGIFQFTQVSTNTYTLSFDTTQLDNGEYKFTLYANLDVESGGADPGQYDVMFSAFGFTAIRNTDTGDSSGIVKTTEVGFAFDPTLIVVAVGIGMVGMLVMRKRRGRKRR